MADQKYDYTVVTPHGDVNLTTASHHSTFDDIEAFLKAHQAAIATACGVALVALNGLNVYLSHGRAGTKL